MRTVIAALAILSCSIPAHGSVRRIKITKSTQDKAPISFSLTTTPDSGQAGHVTMTLVLPTGQVELAELWKVYLWCKQDGRTVLSLPLEAVQAEDKRYIVQYSGHVDTLRYCLVAIRCGKHAPLSETIYQIDLGSYLIRSRVEQFAPKIEPLSQQEIGDWIGKVKPGVQIDSSIIRRGLISDHFTLRADCARYLASHGDLSDVPYLVDALSDESQHVGASYPYAGMSTTRYWANVALICITKQDLGYRWDDPIESRKAAIRRWADRGNAAKETKH